MQLTGTNRSIGLIALITQCPSVQTSPARVWTMQKCVVGQDFKTSYCFTTSLSFAGLVAFARWSDPIPSRTRPSNASAPMVLCLKTWESRSPPGLPSTEKSSPRNTPEGRVATRALSSVSSPHARRPKMDCFVAALLAMTNTGRRAAQQPKTETSGLLRNAPEGDAGWSSPVARQAHNLKVTGSNPVPATSFTEPRVRPRKAAPRGGFLRSGRHKTQ